MQPKAPVPPSRAAFLQPPPARPQVIQRDIDQSFDLPLGKFQIKMKHKVTLQGHTGLAGTVKFFPNDNTPFTDKIELIQMVKTVDSRTGLDRDWRGTGESDRNLVRTAANLGGGVQEGWYVDLEYSKLVPRSNRNDPQVSSSYNSGDPVGMDTHDGQKTLYGGTRAASLYDYPCSTFNSVFSFETIARDTQNGRDLGSLSWGFAVTNAAAGTVANEHANAQANRTATATTAEANFHQFFRNTGTVNAP